MKPLIYMNTSTPSDILSQTLQRIEGAYAPATIRAFKADFNTFIIIAKNIKLVRYPRTHLLSATISIA